MSPSPLVVAERLTKRYGSRLAVNDVSFQIAHGEIVGLLGPNGSGKTSILRMLSGFLAPSAGRTLVEGEDVSGGALSLRAKIGYVPEDGPAYDHMRVGEYLRFAAAIKGIPRSQITGAVDEVLDRLALTQVARLLISKLSRGYRQRVALAQGMIHKPKLLILDEPTNGLDPYQVIELRELVRSLAGQQAVLIASHVLSEIERIADRVLILLDGDLLAERSLKQASGPLHLKLRVQGPQAEIARTITGVAGVHNAETQATSAGLWTVEAERRPGLAEALVAALVAAGLPPAEITEENLDLERTFLETTRQARRREVA